MNQLESPPRLVRFSIVSELYTEEKQKQKQKQKENLNPYARSYKPRACKLGLNPYAKSFTPEESAAHILLSFRTQGQCE